MTEVQQQKPDNFLVWAILTTIFCCLPTGIAAIVYASKVDSAWNAGNYEEAIHAAKNARTWTYVSIAAGIVAGIVSFALGLSTALLGLSM